MSENAIRTDEMTCRKGDIVFCEGDQGSSMYKILRGGAEVWANYGDPEQKLLTKLRDGDYFGEIAVLEICPRTATVIVNENDTVLQVIDEQNLLSHLRGNEGELSGLMRHMSERLRSLTGDYTEVCDTLRELGRLDTAKDRIQEGLLGKIRRFAADYLGRRKAADNVLSQPEQEQGGARHDAGFTEEVRTFRRGDVIFREGSAAECMYDVHAGRVGIYSGYGTPRQKMLTELVPNLFFGEMGLVGGTQRSAAAVALEDDTRLELLRRDDLAELLEKNPAKVLMILRHLSYRLKQLTVDYLKACRTLSEAEKEIQAADEQMTLEARAQIEYLNQILLMPELVY